jgi:RNA ligase (TIGR02306 family)
MSQCFAEVVAIDAINPHPNADKLEIATIRGATVVVGKDTFTTGQPVVYFPPDLLIPELQADKLGVKKYLKNAFYPGDPIKTQCRVAACRLRSYPSYGFVAPLSSIWGHQDDYPAVGTDVSAFVQAVKYEPPRRPQSIMAAEAAPPHPAFHEYTDLEHYWRHTESFRPDELVVVTEKIHGTNSRVGIINVDGEWRFFAGSHHVNRKPADEGRFCVYWEVLSYPGVMDLLTDLCNEQNNVILFGEIFGPSIQDMDYGVERSSRGYRLFDISVNGRYLDWAVVKIKCEKFDVPMVPELYVGPFSQEKLFELRDGPTVAGQHTGKFKGREGVVVKPISERFDEKLYGRLILKSVSADYLDRKGAEDYGEIEAEPMTALDGQLADLTTPDAAMCMPAADRQAAIEQAAG